MRIRDWSSDVCSSDLQRIDFGFVEVGHLCAHRIECAGFFTDLHHLRRHVRKQVRLLHREIELLTRCDLVLHLHDAFGEDERSEEHTSELQSLMRISYAIFLLKKKIMNKKVESRRHKK